MTRQSRPLESKEVIKTADMELDEDSKVRLLNPFWCHMLTIVAISFSGFQLYTAIFGSLAPQLQRSVHLAFCLALAYILYPSSKENRTRKMCWWDVLLVFASCCVALYWIVGYEDIILRAGELTKLDFIMGVIAVLLVMEATRRVCGYPVFIIGTLALTYCLLGKYVPGFFMHRGFSVLRVVGHMYLSTEGMLGVPIGVVSTFVFLFLLFGAFLNKTGVGQFFYDFACALTGRAVGGPAKVSVVSSALQGTISGSSIANVCSTGSFTIPTMKRSGYRPEFAGAVEAAASTGGQLMPPIMGAAAFLMAEFTGIPYAKIAIGAAIPALLYFSGIFLAVHIEAKREGLQGLPAEQVPNLWKVITSRGILFSPIVVIVIVLAKGMTPMRAGLWGIVTAIVAGAIYPESRMKLNDFVDVFTDAAKTAISVGVVSATAGIVVGTISLTGLGLKLATGLVELAHGNLIITMFLTMVSSIILGMGVPTTANYVITSTICGPALTQLGVTVLAAHLFVFYFGIIADVTPPVCSASFAAAAIAKGDPMRTGIEASKLAIGAFLVPYIFVLSPQLLLIDLHWPQLLIIIPMSLLGMYSLASGVQGWLNCDLKVLERIALIVAGVLMIDPNIRTDLLGISLLALVYCASRRRYKKQQSEPTVGAAL